MDTLYILDAVIIAISLVAIIICLVLFKRVKDLEKNNKTDPETIKELEELKFLFKETQSTTKLEIGRDISNSLNKQFLDLTTKVSETSTQQNEVTNRKFLDFQAKMNEAMQKNNETINKSFNELNERVTKSLLDINKQVNEKLSDGFKDTNKTVTNVIERLSKIDAAQKNIESLSTDVVSLKNILENNQARGRYGEIQLKTILHTIFEGINNAYAEQYTLKEATAKSESVRADAVVFLPPPYHLICIDSKFPFQDYQILLDKKEEDPTYQVALKNFKANVKKHINDISSKYIIRDKTADFAFMFVPSDGIFTYIHSHSYDSVEYAQNKRVIICSPATLQAMLSTISMLNINYQRSENLKVIDEELKKLSKEFGIWGEKWNKFSTNLRKANDAREDLDKRVNKITTRFDAINKSNVVKSIEEDESNKDEDVLDLLDGIE